MRLGFDNQKYLTMQSNCIRERISQFGDKLYLELGGKLFDDFHAARVLPGFEPDSKIRMLSQLKDELEIVISINAEHIEKSEKRGDLGITYADEVLRLTDAFRALGFMVGSVCITCYDHQRRVDAFIDRLSALGIKSYRHFPIEDYPYNMKLIVSDNGFGLNEYIETSRPLVSVTGPGPGSGKMATCLSQLYHDNKHGIKAGYAKFETFPVWNLPLHHPVNVAYEAATANLKDVNALDHFHLEAYGKTAVNYNRDLATFPVLKAMMERILGSSPYQSPTDMGVNVVGNCIIDQDVVSEAAKLEILRRYYQTQVAILLNEATDDEIRIQKRLMQQLGITEAICPAIDAALQKAAETGAPAAGLVLPDGRVVTGKTSDLLGPSAALLLNALKTMANIDKEYDLISPQTLEPICRLKTENLKNRNPRLHSDEVLIALSISSATDPIAAKALAELNNLRGCDAHFSVILASVDEKTYKKLGINVTCQPKHQVRKLYHG
ncbi:MAG: DUF1846 domain-containing protein [Clostridia bacterium]|nr:DUF1846 domain-containing protein [Clostridia bacterium]